MESGLVLGMCREARWEIKTRKLNPVLVVEGLDCQAEAEAEGVDPDGHSWCRGAVVCLASCCCPCSEHHRSCFSEPHLLVYKMYVALVLFHSLLMEIP